MAQRPQIAFLRRVFGIGGIAHEITRQREDIVEIGQRGVAKTPRFVLFGIRVGSHRGALGRPNYLRCFAPQSIEHHCGALLPVAASTTIVPIMCG